MARTGLLQDQRFRQHEPGSGHPERPDRLQAIADALCERRLDACCTPIEASPVEMDTVRAVHGDEYVDRLRRACQDGRPFIDTADSAICTRSFEIARLAVGGLLNAVDAVVSDRIDNAFCAIRPPGHHAERDSSLGFCLFNNVAIAAQHLLDHHALSRVLIVDWDVHHGNGTQHIFEEDARVFFVSVHGHPGVVYPGTGYAEECGRGAGKGFTLNLPMLPPSSDAEWRQAFEDRILPAADEFRPEFVLVSSGFDAHERDPLAPLELTTDVFGWMTDRILEVASQHAGGRMVSTLEGGYDLEALGECAALHVARLLEA